ncbi:MAG: hypothetical protein JXA10_01130 [Anaerolineae bacterium]|nr:hypothetical protein [Anaerolineae bacterium]
MQRLKSAGRLALMLPNTLHTRLAVPGFVINSLPKAGTHLLGKAMSLFPGVRYAGVQFDYSNLAQILAGANPSADTIPVGVDAPQPVPLNAIQRGMDQVGRGEFTVWHVPFSDGMAHEIAARNMRSLLMLRDPRDVVVSHARFVATLPDHFLYARYQGLSESEQIMLSIRGLAADDHDPVSQPGLLDIGARCRSIWEWHNQPFNLTTSFEKLIGPQGGGSREDQIAELARIADHVGLRHSPALLAQIADAVFGGTKTFRKGTTGAWAAAFTADHTRVFKDVAGDVLIAMGYEQDHDW